MLRIPARGNAAAPKGERQRGSSHHWKGIFVLVNSRLINLLDSTATTPAVWFRSRARVWFRSGDRNYLAKM